MFCCDKIRINENKVIINEEIRTALISVWDKTGIVDLLNF